MYKFLVRFFVIAFLLLAASKNSSAQTSYSYKGMYVYDIDMFLNDATGNATNILFRYCRDSAFNAITISPGILNLNSSPTMTTKLAAFMKKARTQYGIRYISAVVSDYPTLINEVHPYQLSRTDTLERFNHYNFEFEYWNDANYLPGKLYCNNFLTPGGYTCDSVGAWSYFSKNMKSVDSLANVAGIKSTVYIGVSSKDTLKNRFVANTVDLVMLACYNADTSKLYMSHTVAKLTAYSTVNKVVDVLPIFASQTKSASENLKQYLTGPAPVGKHSEASVMPIFMREYATLSASVRSKIRIVGFKWFKYEGMPKDSSTTTLNSVPTGITATPSSTSAALSWGAVSGATGYRIMYAKTNSYTFTTVNASTNSYTLSGLTANTAYHFLVYSVISGKTSISSPLTVFTTTASGGSCALPNGLSTSGISDVAATISWNAVSGASSYNLQYRIVGAASWVSTTSSTTSKSLSALTASSNYEFQVQANCGTGNLSAFTTSSNFSTTAAPCNSPTGLNSTGVTINSATVGANSVPNATSYNIQYRAVGASSWNPTTSSTVTKTLSGLNASTSYEFQQQAVCPTNTSAFSASSNFSTPAPVCAIPSGLNSTAVTNASATLNWTAVSGASSYVIQYRITGTASWTTATSTTTSKAISGLTASSNYEFQVQTVCSASNSSAFSTSSSFTTAAPPCNTPTGLSSSAITDNSATISWTAVSGATGYSIQYRVTGTSVWNTSTSTSVSKSLSGLSASSTYEFQVQTTCAASATSSFSSSATFTTPAPPCNVPSGLSSSGLTSNGALLSWTAFAGATGYTVQYRIVGASTWTSSACAVTSISLSGLVASSNYEFQVKSVCSASNSSAFSASSTFSTPMPPCNLTAGLASSSVTHNAATLTWTAVAGASGYNINYRKVGVATWTSTTSTSVSKSLSGLSPSSTYEFQVQTNCGSGNLSSFSSSATFTTSATPCSLPSGLANSSLTSNSVTLNWSAVSGASGYAIQYRIVGSSSWTSVSSATNSKAISGLNASTNYEFQVQSDCGGGNISAFTTSSTFTTPAPPCNAVTGLASNAITDNSATLSWTDFAGAASYAIKYRIVGAASWTNTTSSVNTISLTGLTASSTYEYQVQSNCGTGTSAFSSAANFTTLAPPCNIPSGLSPSSVSNNSAVLSWNAISGAASYSIQYRVVGAASWNTISSATNNYNLSGLAANTTYEFAVQTVCSSNSSSYSSAVSFATSAPPCVISSALSATAVTDNSATLNWAAVSGASNYAIQYRIVGNSAWQLATSTSNSVSISSLSANSNYEFQVQTECTSGNTSAFTTAASFTTLPIPCITPSTLSASAITDNSASLSWSNNASASSYSIRYRVIGSASWNTLSSSVNTLNISGLTAVSNYEYQVQADCGSGNQSAFSSSSSFVTLAPPCNIPTGLSSASVTDNSAILSWNLVSGASDYTLQYRIVGSSTWTSINCATNSKALTGLTASSNYEFQTQTNCSSGNSSSFTSSSAFSTSAPPCFTPSGLAASSVTYNSATLNWTAIAGVTSYLVNYRIVGSASWITVTSATSSKALTGLTSLSNYEFQVKSDCGSGNTSAFSTVADFVTPAQPCNLPSGLNASAITYNSANLNWTAVAGVSSYNINYRITGTSTWTSLTSTTNSKSISALTASSNYEFQIQSDCGNNNTSAFTSSALFSTPAPPCNAPTSLSTSGITYNSASINWTGFAGASNYVLKYRIIGAATWTIVNSTTTSYALTGLTSSANYEVKVQSDCGNSNVSSFTSTATFITPLPPCNTPNSLTSSSITSSSANLSWAAVSGVTNYILQYRVVGSTTWTSTNSSSASKTINGLSASSAYEFQVQSDCGAGNLSSFSASSNFTTPAPPCDVPLGLTASAITDVSATLNWIDFAGASGYTIRYRTIGSANWITISSVINTVTVSGLQATSTYEFQLQSNCGASNSSIFSNSSSFTTLAPPCNSPSGLSASNVTNTSAVLTWSAFAGATAYTIQYREQGTVSWTTQSSSATTFSLSGLIANTTYEFAVQTNCGAGSNSSFSSSSTFATSAPPCLSPAGLNANSITDNSVLLSWNSVATAVSYTVEYRITTSAQWNSVTSSTASVAISGLLASTNYEFQVQTSCSSGNSSPFSTVASFTTLPVPCLIPAGISSSAITENSATLSWNNNPSAFSYSMQYREVGTSAWVLLSSALNSINISSLSSTTTYEFQVKAECGQSNSSSFSASYNFTTLSPPCIVPSGLGVSAVSSNSCVLDWNSLAGVGSYTYRYRNVGSSTWTTANTTTNTVALSGLAAATNYEFQVQSDCGNSTTSAFSASSNFLTQAAPCAVPVGLNSSAITYNSATLSWTASAGATGYTLQYRISGSSSWTILNTVQATKNISGLNPAEQYEFEVAADCGAGNISAFSATANFTTLAAPCSVPVGLSAIVNSPNDANIAWTSVGGATAYTVQYRISGSSTWLSVPSTTNSAYLSNLVHSSTYEYQVQSDCGSSNLSAFSAIASLTTPVPPCNVATGVSATNITHNSAILDWIAVSGAASYNVQYRIIGSSAWISVSGGSASSYTLTSLSPAENYEFRVQTVCQTGSQSAFSNTVQFMTDVPPCNIPLGLAVSNITENSANINWTTFNGAIGYNIQYRALTTTSWTNVQSNSNSFSLTNLSPSTGYEFQVESNCSSTITSGFGNPVQFTTDALPCIAPSGLNATSVGSSSATLTWISLSNATAYIVEYRLSGAATWNNINASTNSVSLTNLSPASSYEFQVQTICTSGNSSFSSVSNFSTSNPSCNAPINLTSSSIGETSATVSWSAVSGATLYLVEYRVVGTSIWTSVSTSNTSEVLTGLLSASSYEFHVQSNCSATSSSAFSSGAYFVTLAPPCLVAANLASSGATSNSVNVSWDAVANASGYMVQYKPTGTANWVQVSSTTSPLGLVGLSAGTIYEFQVQTDCSYGLSAFSNSGSFATSAASANSCDTAGGLFASSIKSTSAKLNWNPVNGANTYKVQYKKTDVAIWTNKTTTFTNKSISSLSPNTEYQFKVQTNCNTSTSDYSSIFLFRTAQSLSSAKAATSYMARAIHSSLGITLNWTATQEENIAYYSVERSEDNIEFEPLRNIAAAGNSTFAQDYEFNDIEMKLSPINGTVWYRLSMTDTKGNITYLRTIEVTQINEFEDVFKVYPNPTSDDNINLTVKLDHHEEMLVVLMDILGNQIYSKVIVTDDNGFAASGINPGKDLKPGIYEIVGYSSKRQMSKKLIIF